MPDQESIVLDVDPRSVLAAIKQANQAVEGWEKQTIGSGDKMQKSLERMADMLLKMNDKSRSSIERLTQSIEKQAAAYGKTGVDRLIADRDRIIKKLGDEQGMIDRVTASYVASPLVTAMIKGRIAIIDEGNGMGEKSWASLAPLLDNRRYVESIVAGIKIKAHPHFRLVATMNDDASTFELPEYIHSRLQPQIFIDFPERDEEHHILKENLPFAEERILSYVVDFLQMAHAADERFTVRDGINVGRFAIKRKSLATRRTGEIEALEIAIVQVLGEEALRYGRRRSEPSP